MLDASTTGKRCSRVCRDFETSRLENALLAAAYECAVPAVPTVSRRTRRKVDAPLPAALTAVAQAEMDFPLSPAMERQAG